jgi:hypothetical protein
MESLSRYREAAAGIAVVALALNVAVGLIGAFFSPVSVYDMAVGTAYRVGDPMFVGAVAGLTATCRLRDRTAHARVLTVLGLVMSAAALLVGVGFAVVGLAGRPRGETLEVLSVLPLLVLSAVGVAALVVLLASDQAHAGQLAAGSPVSDAAAAAVPPTPVPVLDAGAQPTWARDAAAGAAWHRAGDAASGAPASGWGDGAGSAGWQPRRNPVQQPPGPASDSGPDPGQR